MRPEVNVFWFRRDLRLHDNAGLYKALKEGKPVLPIFIFDRHILDELEDPFDRRIEFIHSALNDLQKQLKAFGSTLDVRYGFPDEIFNQLKSEYRIEKLFTNHDYEPYARERDESIKDKLKSEGILFNSYKDQVLFEKDEIIKEDGKPYTVFTPYSKKWKKNLTQSATRSYPTEKYFHNFYKQPFKTILAIEEIKFKPPDHSFPGKTLSKELVSNYKENRDIPSIAGTSRLSVHFRFGTISIREKVREALLSETFLNELIWREFYQMIL